MRAYEGDKPYIFVSYAHKDSEKVFQILEELKRRGYRIWYDEGIEPGSEWPENIAQHLMKADTFIAFITQNSMNSANCRREINFALSKDIPFLTIILEKTNIPAGMELQISAQQSILKYNYTDESRFYDKVESCSFLDDCKGDPEIVIPDIPVVVTEKKTPNKMPLWIGLVVLAAVVIFLMIPKEKPVKEPVHNSKDDIVETSDPNVSWVYKINRDSSDLIYTFERGPIITMPIDWDGQIDVVEENESVNFYHKASKDAWQLDGVKGGLLFSLNFSEKQDYLYLPDYQDVGSTSDGFYYLTFPSDLQAYTDNERIASAYSELYSQIDYVKQNVRMN